MQTAQKIEQTQSVKSSDKKVSKMAGVNLELALGNDLVVMLPGRSGGFRGTIVGFDPYEYIVANVRLPQSVRAGLSYRDEIVIKYLHEGTVYGFRSNILNHITRPAPLIFFVYPDSIEKLDLRQASRFNCSIDGTVYTMEGKGYDCLILNVSETGCMVAASVNARDPLNTIDVGQDMLVAMQLGNLGTLKLPIAVKNVSKEKGTLRFGSMFLDINEEERELLVRYVEKIERLSQ